MNQILDINKPKRKIKKIFKIQFIISILFIIIGIIYLFQNMREKERENQISNIISLNAKLNSVFSSQKENIEQEIYFGRIICEKINLDYYIYNNYSEENLKILPCKFSGPDSISENGNICIIGHNYYDDRFFSNLNELKEDDVIFLTDLVGNKYKYIIYEKYEINEKDTEKATKPLVEKELTLCTCTINKSKRLVIRAKQIF